MDKKQPDSPADSLVRFLNALMKTQEPRSLEDLRESVLAMGMDPDRLIARAREQVARAREEARLGWAKRAQALLPTIRQRLGEGKRTVRLTRDQQLARVRDALEGALGEPAREVAAAWRNLEDVPEEDLATLVEDIEALRRLQEELGDDRP